MDLQTTIYVVVGLSFALYIGIAIWARVPGPPLSSMPLAGLLVPK